LTAPAKWRKRAPRATQFLLSEGELEFLPVAPPSGAATGCCCGTKTFPRRDAVLGDIVLFKATSSVNDHAANTFFVELNPNGTAAIRRGRLADNVNAVGVVAALNRVFEDPLEPSDSALVGVGVVRGGKVVAARVTIYRGFVQGDMRLLALVANEDGHGVQKHVAVGISGKKLPEREAVFVVAMRKVQGGGALLRLPQRASSGSIHTH